MKHQPHLKQLRKVIKDNPASSVEQLAQLVGWELSFTQKQISYLVSGGSVKSLPKRYVLAEPNNEKKIRDRNRLEELRAKKAKEKQAKQSPQEIVNAAIGNMSELARAWG